MMIRRLLAPVVAAFGLAGCVAYQEPVGFAPPPRPVYVAPAPAYYAPPPERVYVRPRPRRWVPQRCDAWGRCRGGYWR
jgi:hypothetical protein